MAVCHFRQVLRINVDLCTNLLTVDELSKASFPGWINQVQQATVETWCENDVKKLQAGK